MEKNGESDNLSIGLTVSIENSFHVQSYTFDYKISKLLVFICVRVLNTESDCLKLERRPKAVDHRLSTDWVVSLATRLGLFRLREVDDGSDERH